MTLPNERFNAVRNAREFLYDLLDPKKTPRVPKSVRTRARNCLKHYPWDIDIEGWKSDQSGISPDPKRRHRDSNRSKP